MQKQHKSGRYLHRKQAEEELKAKKSELVIEPTELDDVFRDAMSSEEGDGVDEDEDEVELVKKSKKKLQQLKKQHQKEKEDNDDAEEN